MKYIKNNEEDLMIIPNDFNQMFFYSHMSNASKTSITNLKQEGTIDYLDIKIVQYLWKVVFATRKQLERFCKIENISNAKERINILFQNIIINKFTFVKDMRKEELPDDAKEYFCLASGGKYLLENYTDEYFVEWEPGDVCRGPVSVNNTIYTTEIGLRINEANCKVKSFKKSSLFVIKGLKIFAGCSYLINKNDSEISEYLITDIVNRNTDIHNLREKLRGYESIFSTKIWKKYYSDAKDVPMIVFFTEDDKTALELSKEISLGTNLKYYIVSTRERMKRGFDKEGAFLKYDETSDSLFEIKYPIFS